jgi:hypothetical protein
VGIYWVVFRLFVRRRREIMEIGEPVKRWQVIPTKEPIAPTHEPRENPLPERERESVPAKEKEPV